MTYSQLLKNNGKQINKSRESACISRQTTRALLTTQDYAQYSTARNLKHHKVAKFLPGELLLLVRATERTPLKGGILGENNSLVLLIRSFRLSSSEAHQLFSKEVNCHKN